MRTAIYARYSTDLQSDASIEDQRRSCLRLIEGNGWVETETYADRGISGASHLRPCYQRLLEDARNSRFDVVVAEGLDRISRDQEHIAAFFKQMQFQGIPIVTVAEGEISELHIGLKGTMSSLFLKDLAQKTHRGLEGRVRKGKSAGGLCYGYDVVRNFSAGGEMTTGERVINPDQAEIVRRIFEDYANGVSPRAIAVALNKDRVAGPRGTWGRLDHLRQLAARHRHSEQRTLHRTACLEPPTVPQGPSNGETAGPHEPARGLGYRGSAGASYRA